LTELRLENALVLRDGSINLREARLLSDLVRGLSGKGPIVEMGTLFGWSTRVMSMARTHYSRQLLLEPARTEQRSALSDYLEDSGRSSKNTQFKTKKNGKG
jgi:predicted O-methyltransferase YrrM